MIIRIIEKLIFLFKSCFTIIPKIEYEIISDEIDQVGSFIHPSLNNGVELVIKRELNNLEVNVSIDSGVLSSSLKKTNPKISKIKKPKQRKKEVGITESIFLKDNF